MNGPQASLAPLPNRLAALAQRFGVQDLYAFGSRAEEIAARVHGRKPPAEMLADSDVDIGVRPRLGALSHVDERVELAQALEDLFGVGRVDLVVLTEVGAFLSLAALSGELLYCADATDQAEYELYVLRRAGDLLPIERVRRGLILRHGAR
jgi:predicted nucleotidyltransferase